MELLLTSVIAFVSTNIDDLFILTLFFGGKEFKAGEIIAGQLMGITTLIVLSLLGSLAALFVDPAYLGLLGLIPIYLGVKGAIGSITRRTLTSRVVVPNARARTTFWPYQE
jgi:cadmium resistance protein CadD (predicted permease)